MPTPTITAQAAVGASTETPAPKVDPTAVRTLAAAAVATRTRTPEPKAVPTQASPAARSLPPRVLSASLRPLSIAPGGGISARVQTSGSASGVEMYLGSGTPTGPAPLTFSMSQISTGVWSATGTAPSAPGEYHFTVGLYVNGRRTIVDNDSWNVRVSGPAASAGPGAGSAQPVPSDILLAPPFSYGSPVAATFSAAGRTVSGSEVTSTTRPDVAPATVSRWYAAHLPRAGWTIDPSALPSPAATSFTIVGTMGNRVCVIQYGGYTVHVFYGTIAA